MLIGTLSALSVTVSFLVRFELSGLDQGPVSWRSWWLTMLALALPVRLAIFSVQGLHRASWRFASLRDLPPLLGGVVAGSLVTGFGLLLSEGPFPRSVLAIDLLLCCVLVAASRYAYLVINHFVPGNGRGRQRALIIGAGRAGGLTMESMLAGRVGGFRPVGILDDDPLKQGTTLCGVRVLGPIEDVAGAVLATDADVIVLALPTVESSRLYNITKLCRDTGLPLKTIPDLEQILVGSNVVNRVYEFRIEDLLLRRPVRPDVPEIRRMLQGNTVLVTGAAGSIGSELCRQIAGQGAARLIGLDNNENGLFRLEHELRELDVDAELVFILADIRDRRRLGVIFSGHRPDVVFHAAAYKHVPILQHHPVEAVRNNVGGTRNVAELSSLHGVDKFVMISTDKAVNPTSVMGATKRIAEKIVQHEGLSADTRFATIRFGNVLGSNGSVVELFLKQIREGRPVTVTHPRIERFFMTIAEAVQLVLFAATMSEGGEVFIVDMGEPVRIDDLARQMIKLSGLVPDADVPVVYTGLRPGEKLYEELWTEAEKPGPTGHPGILMAKRNGGPPSDLREKLDTLIVAAEVGDEDTCWEGILDLVPTFRGRTNGMAAVPPDLEEAVV